MSNTSQRQYERLLSQVVAQLRLPDGQLYQGMTRDMGFGGVFLVTPLPPADLPRGIDCILALDLFDRQVEMDCQIAHVTPEGIGLKLKRVFETS